MDNNDNIDDMDEFDFDSDDFSMDIESEEPPPANSREAVSRSIKDMAKGFTESYTDDKSGYMLSLAKEAIPKSISTEVTDLGTTSDTIKDEFVKATKEIRSSARSTLDTVEKILPKNDKVKKVFDKISNLLGTEDKGVSSGPSKDEIIAKNINESIISVLGEKEDKDKVEELVKEQVEANRFKSANELNSLIATNTSNIREYNTNIASRYFRKSLELQFKSLYVHKEQLEITKNGFDLFKNQLESIVNNTSLPDILKIHKTEAFKSQMVNRTISDMQDNMFKEGSWLGNAKKNVNGIIGNVKDKALGVLDGINTGLGSAPDIPGTSKSNLAGGMISDFVREKIGSKIGSKIGESERGSKFINAFKNMAMDPSEFLRSKSSELSDSSKLGAGTGSKILNSLADITKIDNNVTTGIIDKQNMDDPAIFDVRTKNSIVEVIPGLLSKIYGELKTKRVGGTPEDNEIRYNSDERKFLSSKDYSKNFNDTIKNKVNKAANNDVEEFINLLVDEGGLYIKNKSDHKLISKGITKYVISGKTLVPSRLLINGFDKNFDKKFRVPITTSINKILNKTQKDPNLLTTVNTSLKNIKKALPNIKKEVSEAVASGNIGSLVKSGFAEYDKDTGTHKINDEKVKNLIIDSIGSEESYTNKNISNLTNNKIDTIKNKHNSKVITTDKNDKLIRHKNIIDDTNKEASKDTSKLTNSISKLTDTIKNVNGLTKTNKVKKNPFDKDGDGDRDGNWKDRLNMLTKKKDKKETTPKSKEDKSKSNIFGLLTNMLGVVGGIGKGIFKLPKLLGGMLLKKLPGLLAKSVGKALIPSIKLLGRISKFGMSSLLKLGKFSLGGAGKLLSSAGSGLLSAGSKLLKTGGSLISGIGSSLFGSTEEKVVSEVGEKVSSKVGKDVGKKVSSKIASKTVGKKVKTGVIKGFLSRLKSLILKKFGKIAGAKLIGKIASRFFPFIGTAMLAYDAAMIGYDMYENGTSLKSAISKQIIGFDIFSDEEAAKDDDGNLIKPDEPKIKDDNVVKQINNTEDGKKISTSKDIVENNRYNNSINNSDASLDGEQKVSGNHKYVNNNFTGGTLRSALVRDGSEFNPEHGEENLIMADKNVDTSGLNPIMYNKLRSMANEYYELTGKKITLNSAYRSTEYQRKLRNKYGNKAAKPGHSTHEFGLAVDINGSTLDELDKLGLIGKYKFTRPVGGEKWHMEPAGIQLDINGSKKDPSYAAKLIDSVNNGGSGWGLENGVKEYSRNKEFQESIISSKPKIIKSSSKDNNPDIHSTINNVPYKKDIGTKISTINKIDYKGSNGTTNEKIDIPKIDNGINSEIPTSTDIESNKLNAVAKSNSALIKPVNDTVKISKMTNETLVSIDDTLKKSLEVQMALLEKFDGLASLSNSNTLENKTNNDKITPANNNIREELPDPAVSLARKKY